MLKSALAAMFVLAGAAFADDAPPPPADPVPLLDESKTAFGTGEYAHARRAAETAVKVIVAKEAEAIRALLPAPFDGWTMNDGDASSLGILAADGGMTVDRTYTSADGQSNVRIEILADSMMVEQMSAMYSNTAMLEASGAKVETIGGETAIIDPGTGQITVMVGTRMSVTISGAPADIVKSYAQNVNFAGLKALK